MKKKSFSLHYSLLNFLLMNETPRVEIVFPDRCLVEMKKDVDINGSILAFLWYNFPPTTRNQLIWICLPYEKKFSGNFFTENLQENATFCFSCITFTGYLQEKHKKIWRKFIESLQKRYWNYRSDVIGLQKFAGKV